MTIVYHKETGEAASLHDIDAIEAVKSGMYTREKPVQKVAEPTTSKPVDVEVDKTETTAQKEEAEGTTDKTSTYPRRGRKKN